MKKIISNIMVIALVVTTSAQATWLQSVRNAIQDTQNWVSRNYFFATKFSALKNVTTKMRNDEKNVTAEELKLAGQAINFSSLSEDTKTRYCALLNDTNKETQQKKSFAVAQVVGSFSYLGNKPHPQTATITQSSLQEATEALDNILQAKQIQYITTAAVTIAGMGFLYAYKRLTRK